jgi:hypothetical protein
MSITVSREGRRSYILGNTFAFKSAIKDAGAHWDGDRRAWWIGKHDEADALVARLTNPAVAEKVKADQDAERLERDRENILGTAKKDGKSYYFVGEGTSAKGDWVRLLFRDGSKTFFAERASVQIEKRYRSAMSLRKLQEYATERKTTPSSASNAGPPSKYCTSPRECISAMQWDAPDRLCRACESMCDRMGYA